MRYTIIFIILFTLGCSQEHTNDNASQKNGETSGTKHPKQLNINILLDLSDRIDPVISPDKPEHAEKDIEIIGYLAQYFVNDMNKKGTYQSKGKIRVNFYPRPNDPNIHILAEKLNADVSKMDVKQKKEIHDHLQEDFTGNLKQIYSSTIKEQHWTGSDIWRFFKNDVIDYCVAKDTCASYRNVLIIVTDGYIFHEDSKNTSGNRYEYLLPGLLDKHKLRNNSQWREEMQKQDFGLISTRKDLDNLEVMVLEVTPSPGNKDDEDIIKAVLSKWLGEMHVKRYAIHNSDLPQYTKQRIADFLDK
jgi:hypothetical protein